MDSRSVRRREGQPQGSDMGAEGKMRSTAEVGLSRKVWGGNQPFHTGLIRLPVRPSSGQDTQAVGGLISLRWVSHSNDEITWKQTRREQGGWALSRANLNSGPINQGLYLERGRCSCALRCSDPSWILCLGLVERYQPALGGVCRHHSISGAGEMPSSVWSLCRLPQAGEQVGRGPRGPSWAPAARAQRVRLQLGVKDSIIPGRLSRDGAG